MRMLANVEMNVSGTLVDDMIQLRGEGTATVNETDIQGIAVAPVHLDVDVDGAIDLGADSHRSHGLIMVTIASDGVSLNRLVAADARRLPATDAPSSMEDLHVKKPWRLPDQLSPSGSVRGAARLAIPLATIFDPSTFQLDGVLDATDVAINGVVITDGVGTVLLDSGEASIRCEGVQLRDEAANHTFSLDTAVQATLHPATELHAEFQVKDLAACTVARVADISIGEIDGTFAARALVSCPMNHLNDAQMWRGSLDFHADSIRVNNELLADFEGSCKAEAGQFVLHKLCGFLAGGEVSGSGVIALTKPHAFRSEVAVRRVDIAAITKIVKNPPKLIGEWKRRFVVGGEWADRITLEGSWYNPGLRPLRGKSQNRRHATGYRSVTKNNRSLDSAKELRGGELHVRASFVDPVRRTPGPQLTRQNRRYSRSRHWRTVWLCRESGWPCFMRV